MVCCLIDSFVSSFDINLHANLSISVIMLRDNQMSHLSPISHFTTELELQKKKIKLELEKTSYDFYDVEVLRVQ